MKKITVRGVPNALAAALVAEKRRRGNSLNRTVIELLSESLGVGSHTRSNGLGRLAGSWSETELREFERTTKFFEELDV